MNNPEIPVYGRSPVLNILVAVYFLLIGNGLLTIFLSVNLARNQLSTNVIGLVMSGYYFGFILGTRAAHRIVNTFGHIRAFVIFAALAACSALLHGVIVSLSAWLLLRFMFGGFYYSVYPLAVCITADEFSSAQLVAASATILQVWGISAAIGPIASAYLMSAFGTDALFYFLGTTGLLLSLIGYQWRGLGHIPGEQSEFIAVPRTTPIIAQLDPRSEEP
jgi:MFS family permease